MSRLLPSASPRPLVSSGIADVTPPVPVVVVAPAPVLLEPQFERERLRTECGCRPECHAVVDPVELERKLRRGVERQQAGQTRNKLDKKAGGHYHAYLLTRRIKALLAGVGSEGNRPIESRRFKKTGSGFSKDRLGARRGE